MMNRNNIFSPNRTSEINNITTLEQVRVTPSPLNNNTPVRFPDNDSVMIMQEYLRDHNMTMDQFISEARSINITESTSTPERILSSLDGTDSDVVSQSENDHSDRVSNVDRIIRSSLALGQRLAQVSSLSESENVSQHVHDAVDSVVKNTSEFIASNSKSSVSAGTVIVAGAAAVIVGGAIYFTLGKLPFRLLPNISSLFSSSSSSDSQQTISLPISSSEKATSGFHIGTYTFRKILKFTLWFDNSNNK